MSFRLRHKCSKTRVLSYLSHVTRLATSDEEKEGTDGKANMREETRKKTSGKYAFDYIRISANIHTYPLKLSKFPEVIHKSSLFGSSPTTYQVRLEACIVRYLAKLPTCGA